MILGPGDTSRGRPARIIVAGTSGAGKTTLSAAISRTLGIEHVEIDALYHGPDWTRRESFEADVAEFSSRAEWVTEWQYGVVRDQLADRADLVVWLDLPRRSVMRQVITRTVRRRFRREVLWNDNIEPPLHRILFEADHIVRWAWTTHHKTSTRIDELSERLPHLDISFDFARGPRSTNGWLSRCLAGVHVDDRVEWMSAVDDSTTLVGWISTYRSKISPHRRELGTTCRSALFLRARPSSWELPRASKSSATPPAWAPSCSTPV